MIPTNPRPIRRTIQGTVFFLALFSGEGAGAQTTPSSEDLGQNIRVEGAVIAERIENLSPVNPGTVFPADIGKVYCFTRIHTASFPTRVKHLWFQGDNFVMEIILRVNSPSWRTYSSKTILPSSVGNWRVDVTSEDGTILETLAFTIQ